MWMRAVFCQWHIVTSICIYRSKNSPRRFFVSFNENSVYIKMHVLKSSRSGVSFVNVSYEMTDHADSDEERLRRLKNGRNSERQWRAAKNVVVWHTQHTRLFNCCLFWNASSLSENITDRLHNTQGIDEERTKRKVKKERHSIKNWIYGMKCNDRGKQS